MKIFPDANEYGSTQSTLTIAIAVAGLVALVVFFGPEKQQQVESPSGTAETVSSPTASPDQDASTSNQAAKSQNTANPALATMPKGAVQVLEGSADNPPAELPEDLQDALRMGDQQLPPEMEAQLKAPPPELPEDLKRQLANQPTELPPDLKAQLNAPPPPIPDDIRRALETPPREVSIEEVNTPPDAR